MTKQELIEKINELRICKGWTDLLSRKDVLELVEQLSEPKKVVIPNFVAEWIEHRKREYKTISNFFVIAIFSADVYDWYYEDEDSHKEILFRAWLDGYEVEKEKLYVVELPNGQPLVYDEVRELCYISQNLFDTPVILTESRIKKDFAWAWNAGFAKEVQDEQN